jgi:GTPase SAR1 family protein
MGILLVYDVTDEASFNNIRNWIRNIEQHASDNVNKVRLRLCAGCGRLCVRAVRAAAVVEVFAQCFGRGRVHQQRACRAQSVSV